MRANEQNVQEHAINYPMSVNCLASIVHGAHVSVNYRVNISPTVLYTVIRRVSITRLCKMKIKMSVSIEDAASYNILDRCPIRFFITLSFKLLYDV